MYLRYRILPCVLGVLWGSFEVQAAPLLKPEETRVPVRVEQVVKAPIPFKVRAVGSVQPISNIPLRTRIDATVSRILVEDGTKVRKDDILIQLDSRQIEAQIRQAEAALAKDRALQEQNEKSLARATALYEQKTGSEVNLETAQTQSDAGKAQVQADQAQVDQLRVQLDWHTIKAPVTGRVGVFSTRPGSIVRAGDNTATGIFTNLIQTSPIYVSFSLPQIYLGDVKEAVKKGANRVVASPQGGGPESIGKIAVIGNSVDVATGTIPLQAIFENKEETLWPGQLCNVEVTLRIENEAIAIPRTATLYGQSGTYVYVVEGGVARIRPIEIARTQDGKDLIAKGLKGDELIVVDGALLLKDGAPVSYDMK